MEKHYEAIKVGDLKVDRMMDTNRLYMQREEQEQWTKKIIENWDAEMLLPAIVSHRSNGEKIIIDGQHSNAGAVAKEGANFLRDCMVYENLTPQQEAKLFLAANKHRKAVRPFDNFRVSLTAGDPVAIRVDREVRAIGNGLEISGSPSTHRVGAVQALLALGQTEGMVQRVLAIASKAWGFDQSTWDNLILRALGMLLDTNWDQADDVRLIKVLKKGGTPAIWKQNSVRLTSGGGGSSSRSYPMVQQMVSDYNLGLDRDKMLILKAPRKTAK
ncbi:DUF6551 family protein [Rhodococcus qingshengii]